MSGTTVIAVEVVEVVEIVVVVVVVVTFSSCAMLTRRGNLEI